jgi:hypothetical protein
MPQEPFVTWNLFVTLLLMPLCVAILGMWIKRQFELSDQRKRAEGEKIAQLLAEKESMKEDAIKERWATYSATLCAIKETVEGIKEDMHKKVTWEHCDSEHDKIDERLRSVGA